MAKRKGNRIRKPMSFESAPKEGDLIIDFGYQRLTFTLSNKEVARLEEDYKAGTLTEEGLAVLEDIAGGDIDSYVAGKSDDDLLLEQAEALLVDITEDTPPEQTREAAEAALKITARAYDARVLLARIAPYEEGLEVFQKGLDIAEEQFSAILPEAGKKGDLWNHRPARGYMRFLRDLVYYQMMHGKLGEAIETSKEILELNQNDHQAVRQTLFLLLLITNRREELAEWMGKFPNDWLLGTHVAQAGLSILNEVDTLPEELRKEISSKKTEKRRKLLLEHLPKSQEAIRILEERSKYITTFLSSNAVIELLDPEITHYQSADEAVETAKVFYTFWCPYFFPVELTYSMESSLPENPSKADLRWVQAFYSANAKLMKG